MPMNDPISDMLTRIRNANLGRHSHVNIKRNKVCEGLAKVLKTEGFIADYSVIEDQNQGEIRVELKYAESGDRVLQGLERVSKPGCRVYRGQDELPRVMDGLGLTIVSTSRGILSDRECRKQNIGGEVLCKVW